MAEIALTPEQREFAEEHHNLIYSFLRKNDLNVADFYDIVVFGFLSAVKEYLERKDLQKYAFTTIAWRKMKHALSNYYRDQNRHMRKGLTISMDSVVYGDEYLTLSDVLSGPDPLMQDFETELMLHELAGRVSRQQMRVIRMKVDGYGVKEIARRQNTTIKTIQGLLEDVRSAVLAVCYE